MNVPSKMAIPPLKLFELLFERIEELEKQRDAHNERLERLEWAIYHSPAKGLPGDSQKGE